jgi:hypothetical protein
MDDDGQVTECPGELEAVEYQRAHGGAVVSRVTIRTVGWS